MKLLSKPSCLDCHRIRLIIAYKEIELAIEYCEDENSIPDNIVDINPDRLLPVLIERDEIIYNSRIIMEYLDERFPYPPLLPAYPIERVHYKLFMHRFEKHYQQIIEKIMDHRATAKEQKLCHDAIISLANHFQDKRYFKSDDFSIMDVFILPILWRLEQMDIDLSKHSNTAKMLMYMKEMFTQKFFQNSLSSVERSYRRPNILGT